MYSLESVYKFLIKYIQEHGYPPTIKEIKDVMGMKSTSTVQSYLITLDKIEKIKYEPTKSRAIKIIGYKFVKCES